LPPNNQFQLGNVIISGHANLYGRYLDHQEAKVTLKFSDPDPDWDAGGYAWGHGLFIASVFSDSEQEDAVESFRWSLSAWGEWIESLGRERKRPLSERIIPENALVWWHWLMGRPGLVVPFTDRESRAFRWGVSWAGFFSVALASAIFSIDGPVAFSILYTVIGRISEILLLGLGLRLVHMGYQAQRDEGILGNLIANVGRGVPYSSIWRITEGNKVVMNSWDIMNQVFNINVAPSPDAIKALARRVWEVLLLQSGHSVLYAKFHSFRKASKWWRRARAGDVLQELNLLISDTLPRQIDMKTCRAA
jgi:hypothetical protein